MTTNAHTFKYCLEATANRQAMQPFSCSSAWLDTCRSAARSVVLGASRDTSCVKQRRRGAGRDDTRLQHPTTTTLLSAVCSSTGHDGAGSLGVTQVKSCYAPQTEPASVADNALIRIRSNIKSTLEQISLHVVKGTSAVVAGR